MICCAEFAEHKMRLRACLHACSISSARRVGKSAPVCASGLAVLKYSRPFAASYKRDQRYDTTNNRPYLRFFRDGRE